MTIYRALAALHGHLQCKFPLLSCELSDKHLQGLLCTSFSVLLCPVKTLEIIITSRIIENILFLCVIV